MVQMHRYIAFLSQWEKTMELFLVKLTYDLCVGLTVACIVYVMTK